ncbi:ABC transporter permease, partial [Azospirillum sp. B506]|uniref:ABC transporter permease n=1 Tax=Azospirillum sp. B506 TaxID=137721 RepID=UPI0005B25952
MSFIRLEPRGQASKTMVYVTPLLAVALTLLSGFILFLALGFDPFKALYSFFVAPVTSVRGVGELVVKATPLVLCAVGLAIGFRANVWNIGAEGQLTLGAITGGGIALAFYGEGGWWLLPLMVIGGAIGGAMWAAVPAYLRLRFNASEILTSLMLNYVGLLLLNYLVHGPFRDPDGFAFPESRLFEADAVLPILWTGTRVHLGALFALAAVAGGWLLMA